MMKPKPNHPLRNWRERHGLSQQAVADMLKVDDLTVSRWECGHTEPQKRHWDQIERITGMTRSQFLGFLTEAAE